MMREYLFRQQQPLIAWAFEVFEQEFLAKLTAREFSLPESDTVIVGPALWYLPAVC
jgi:hypothetical protein